MQNKGHIGYDETKKMLNALRKLNESTKNKNILKENDDASSQNSDIDVINDVDVNISSSDQMDLKLSDEHKNAISGLIDSFRGQISDLANLEPGLTIKNNQIRLDGNIPNIDINFVFIAGEEMGLYINADMLKMSDDTLIELTKLNKFNLTYQDTLNPIIRARNNN